MKQASDQMITSRFPADNMQVILSWVFRALQRRVGIPQKLFISSEIQTTFCKYKPVPVPILEDLNEAYDAGIKKGIK